MDEHYDGTPAMAGASARHMQGAHRPYALTGIREGVVEEVFPKDAPGNRSRSYTEYTVRDLQSGVVYNGVRFATLFGNADNGLAVTHRSASRTLNGSGLRKKTPAKSTDATRVLFSFVEGSKHRPVILGCLDHDESSIGATTADGECFTLLMNGTKLSVARDGAFAIERRVSDTEKTTLVIDTSGNVNVTHKRGASVVINDDGKVSIDSSSTSQIVMQGGTLGVARLHDLIDSNADFARFLAQVVAALGVASANVALTQPAGATPLSPIVVPTVPTSTIATISKASEKVKAG